MEPLLKIATIETLYYDRIYALHGLSLEVKEKEIFAVLGPNGAGKTTLLKTIAGLLKDQPKKGIIEFMGKRIDGLDTDKIVRMGITLVPEGREVFEELTIRENLLMGAYTRKNKKKIDDDFDRVFSYFPILKDRVNQWAGTLSGGEQQRVALARAFVASPTLILADEPTGNLDSMNGEVVMELLQKLNAEGATICMVTHDERMAEKTERIIRFFDGCQVN